MAIQRMDLEGKGQVEGIWADRTVGLDGVQSEIAVMRTPDGHGKLELSKYHAPVPSAAEHGAELLGEVANYEGIFRLCYLRGPAGIIVALAEQIGANAVI